MYLNNFVIIESSLKGNLKDFAKQKTFKILQFSLSLIFAKGSDLKESLFNKLKDKTINQVKKYGGLSTGVPVPNPSAPLMLQME